MTLLLIALGAAIGAPARYLTDRAVQSWHESRFPFGTLTVNVVASFVLGLVTGAAVAHDVAMLIGTGLCGALSTYSTFGYETVKLAEDGYARLAAANVLTSLVAGVGAAAAGWAVGAALF